MKQEQLKVIKGELDKLLGSGACKDVTLARGGMVTLVLSEGASTLYGLPKRQTLRHDILIDKIRKAVSKHVSLDLLVHARDMVSCVFGSEKACTDVRFQSPKLGIIKVVIDPTIANGHGIPREFLGSCESIICKLGHSLGIIPSAQLPLWKKSFETEGSVA